MRPHDVGVVYQYAIPPVFSQRRRAEAEAGKPQKSGHLLDEVGTVLAALDVLVDDCNELVAVVRRPQRAAVLADIDAMGVNLSGYAREDLAAIEVKPAVAPGEGRHIPDSFYRLLWVRGRPRPRPALLGEREEVGPRLVPIGRVGQNTHRPLASTLLIARHVV